MHVYYRRLGYGGESAFVDWRRTAGVGLQPMPTLASLTITSKP